MDEEKETLAAYEKKLSDALSQAAQGGSLSLLGDMASSSPLASALETAKGQLEATSVTASTASPSLLLLTDRIERTGRWALAADALGYRGLVLCEDKADEKFFLTFFGNNHFETTTIHLPDLALPAQGSKGYALFALGLLLFLLRSHPSLLSAVDEARSLLRTR